MNKMSNIEEESRIELALGMLKRDVFNALFRKKGIPEKYWDGLYMEIPDDDQTWVKIVGIINEKAKNNKDKFSIIGELAYMFKNVWGDKNNELQ